MRGVSLCWSDAVNQSSCFFFLLSGEVLLVWEKYSDIAARARYRWEIEFFTSLGSSAYLRMREECSVRTCFLQRCWTVLGLTLAQWTVRTFWQFSTELLDLWLHLVVTFDNVKQFLRFVVSIWLKTRIPPKVTRAPWFHNFPLKNTND